MFFQGYHSHCFKSCKCACQVGEAFCADDADQKAQALLLGHYTHILTDPKTSGREITVAVQAVGELAASTMRFFGAKVNTVEVVKFVEHAVHTTQLKFVLAHV